MAKVKDGNQYTSSQVWIVKKLINPLLFQNYIYICIKSSSSSSSGKLVFLWMLWCPCPFCFGWQASHRDLLSPTYVWILQGWYPDGWWKDDKNSSCTPEVMLAVLNRSLAIIPDGYFPNEDESARAISTLVSWASGGDLCVRVVCSCINGVHILAVLLWGEITLCCLLYTLLVCTLTFVSVCCYTDFSKIALFLHHTAGDEMYIMYLELYVGIHSCLISGFYNRINAQPKLALQVAIITGTRSWTYLTYVKQPLK